MAQERSGLHVVSQVILRRFCDSTKRLERFRIEADEFLRSRPWRVMTSDYS